jgi:hypothetical protein
MSFHAISYHFMSFHVVSYHFISFHVLSCHFMSFDVSLDFSDQLSIKSGQGQGQGRRGSNMSSLAFGDSFAVRPKAKRHYFYFRLRWPLPNNRPKVSAETTFGRTLQCSVSSMQVHLMHQDATRSHFQSFPY